MGLSEEALQQMRRVIGDDDRVLADILQSFVDEVDTLVDGLAAAIASSDAAKARGAAHTLKASCRDLGDHVTADLCASLEANAKASGVGLEATKAEMIRQRCLALKSEVTAYIKKLGNVSG